MRKIVVAPLLALIVVGGAGTGWWVYRHVLYDSVAAGEALLARGDAHAAALELRNAVRRHPENARAHVLLARAQLRQGDAVAAEKELKQARALRYPGPDLPPLLARAYLGQERFLDLLRDIPSGTLPAADEARVQVSRAMAQTALGDIASARASATTAERLDPMLADARLAEARILAVGGNRVQALLKVDEALTLDPKLLEALGLKADVLREQGDLDRAVATLDAAVEAGPKLPRVRVARARLLMMQGLDDKAGADLDIALKAEPGNAVARYLKALLLIRARDWKAADLEMQKIQPVIAQLPRGDYYYALVKSNVGQLEQASEQVTRYAARNPRDPDGFRLLARVQLLMDKKIAAAESLKRVAALGGTAADLPAGASAEVQAAAAGADSPEGLTRLATQQIDQGDTAGAARDLAETLEAPPKPADTGATQVLSALAAADLDRAQAALDRVARDANADPRVVANLTGLVRMSALDFDGARAVWEEAVKRWPTAVPMRINLARVLEVTDQAAACQGVLADILTAQPAQGTALRMMIELLVAHGQVNEAIDAVKAARAAAPDAVPLLVTEAALHAMAKDYSAAYAVLDEVPLEQAQSPLLLNVRARIQLGQGRVKDAADSDRQILLAHPENQEIRQQLIQTMVETKQGEEALRLAREGLARAPGNSTMMELVASMVNLTQGMEAAQAEAASMLRDPVNLPAARMLKGSLYMIVGDYDRAAAAYRREMRQAPFTALAMAEATALGRGGHVEEATALLRDWVAEQPDPTVSDALAATDITARRYDLAEKNLRAVLAEQPDDSVALNNLAWIEARMGDPKAHALARRAYLLQPTAQTADTLGWVLLREGNIPVGQLLLRRAAASMPRDPAVLYHFATALKMSGDTGGATRLLGALLASNPSFDERDEALKLLADLGGTPPPAATAATAATADPARK